MKSDYKTTPGYEPLIALPRFDYLALALSFITTAALVVNFI